MTTDGNEQQGDALLPCPWCGSAPNVFEDGEIQCSNKKCPVRPSARWGDTEAWNTRVLPVVETLQAIWDSDDNSPRAPLAAVEGDALKAGVSAMWEALKREACKVPDEAKQIVFLSEEKFRRACHTPAELPQDSCSHWREGDSDHCVWCGDDLGPTTKADVAPPLQPEGEQGD